MNRSETLEAAYILISECLGPNADAPLLEFSDPSTPLKARQIVEYCISWLAHSEQQDHCQKLTNFALIAERSSKGE